MKKLLSVFLSFALAFNLILPVPVLATISGTTTMNSYTCNGTTTAYSYTFKIFEDDDILAIKKLTTTGAETTLVLDSNYTVSGEGDTGGGTVTLTTGSVCASGYTLHLIRNVELTQETDYVDGDAFPADAHESALDKLTMAAQQLQRDVDRAVKIAVTESGNIIASGNASYRSNKVIGFNDTGSNVQYYDNPAVAQASANASATAAATSAASANVSASSANASAVSTSNSAATATTQATNASNSAATASTSATNASNSAANASTSATNASNSAATASTSATNASNSATNASNSAANASTSATNASNSAATASTSATNASNSAATASTSATNASASAVAAAASAVDASNAVAAATSKAKVSSSDTTSNFLSDKIIASANVTVSIVNSGGNEQLAIAATLGNAKYFYAYASASQNVTANTWTKISINTELSDTDNVFDSVTNYRIVIPSGEVWYLFGRVTLNHSTTIANRSAIFKNGSIIAYYGIASYGGSGESNYTMPVSGLYVGNGTDYYELYTWHNGTAGTSAGEIYTTFGGFKIK